MKQTDVEAMQRQLDHAQELIEAAQKEIARVNGEKTRLIAALGVIRDGETGQQTPAQIAAGVLPRPEDWPRCTCGHGYHSHSISGACSALGCFCRMYIP